ncbi:MULTISPECIES: glycerol-3-phosphate 1-O-acyltransferase PlsY [unclassified Exiguobacterium]|uniref:glycerol-3-phosphate 1-O-acyltransferase PlsY n=1 Tax=unclassified Exiguobacterium TaxID=2644629 RepID=UPI000B58B6A7|nr:MULTISPECIES: glycerol-3-phosphate 1-O-acyltransferase PlsY [unclassified Exiguobacterium]ASI35088.1 glycerol-3-phosphate acyltransferase [Exiguobacterium sp. N4-1P]
MIEIIGILILGYLLGSIPFALLVGKWGHGIDIRQHGSGNLGTTNTFRVLGKKAGIIVLIGDLGKGAVASLAPILLASELHPLFAGIAAVIGHIYPIFAKFKGGKAVATSGGMLLVTSPLLFLILLVSFLTTLRFSRMVSLSSIVAASIGIVAAVSIGIVQHDWIVPTFFTVLALFVIFKHRDNIGRIRQGTESKIPLFDKEKQ